MSFIEHWKDIIGYEGLYQVSDFGRVKRVRGYQCRDERILSCVDNGNGYLKVMLHLNGKAKKQYIHRLVAQAFIPNIENKKWVNHKDWNSANNQIENLEWSTVSENSHYSRKQKNTSSAHKGVCWHKVAQKWMVSISKNKKQVYGGLFNKESEAVLAYNNLATKIYGNFALTNVLGDK